MEWIKARARKLSLFFSDSAEFRESKMVQVPEKTLTLEAFLKLPETKPASEYINGEERSLLLYPSGKQPEYRQHEHDVLPVPDLVTNLQLTVGDVLRVHPSFAMSINA
jgi:hypothetical protein